MRFLKDSDTERSKAENDRVFERRFCFVKNCGGHHGIGLPISSTGHMILLNEFVTA